MVAAKGKKFLNYILDKENIIRTLNITLTLLALNLMSQNMGLFDVFFMRFLSICLLISIIIINLFNKDILNKILRGLKKKINNNLLIGIILIIFSFCVLILTKNRFFWLVSIPILLSGLHLVLYEYNVKNRGLNLLILVTFLFSLFTIYIDNVPLLWNPIQRFSLIFTQAIGSLIGKPLLLGPTASGLWILILFLIFNITLFFVSKRNIKKLIFGTIGLFIAWIIFLIFIAFYQFESTVDLVNSQYVFFILGLVPTLIYVSTNNNLNLKMYYQLKRKKKANKKVNSAILIIAITLLLSTTFLTTFIGAESDTGKILINRKNLSGAWTKPEHGVYDRYLRTGMFGLFDIHLRNYGYDVEILDENVSERTFDGVDVFVVINLDENFSSKEQKIIWNFVQNGGSLLVMGDHTDISHMMKPLNEFLDPVGISFRFDSAMPLFKNPQWAYCIHQFYHPVNLNVDNENQIAISVGASLDINKNAFPILVGKYAFSDIGNYLNSPSYLGDYEHNEREQLNDIILVAGAYYGKGKVIVFGDTSSFQNTAQFFSHPLLINVFKWLNSSQNYTYLIINLVILVISLVAVIVLYLFFIKKKVFSILFPLFICFGLIISSFANPLIIGQRTIQGQVIYIDASHGERINFAYYQEDSVDGLSLNFARNNYTSYLLYDYSEDKIKLAKGFVLIAPTKSLSSGEIAFLKQRMEDGLLLILSVGYQDKDSSQDLLNEFDLDVQNIPLGPVPLEETEGDVPKFVDAWPISYTKNNDTESFYQVTVNNITYDLIVLKKYGKGAILLIADSQFLLDKNLERQYSYNEANIEFLRTMINVLREKEVLK